MNRRDFLRGTTGAIAATALAPLLPSVATPTNVSIGVSTTSLDSIPMAMGRGAVIRVNEKFWREMVTHGEVYFDSDWHMIDPMRITKRA